MHAVSGCSRYQDYERLAAQLDGARQPLAEKVQKYAPSANKIPLVEAAEKHAEMLDQLARNLSRCVSISLQVCDPYMVNLNRVFRAR